MTNKIEDRLEKLEAKMSPDGPRFIFIYVGGRDDGEIIGFKNGDIHVQREPGETLEALKARMFEALSAEDGVLIIGAIYE